LGFNALQRFPAFFEVERLGELGTSTAIPGFERISPTSSMEGGTTVEIGDSPGPPPPDEISKVCSFHTVANREANGIVYRAHILSDIARRYA